MNVLDEALLMNALNLADHHRKHCDGAECNVNLWMLWELLRRAGIEVPKEVERRFV
jgi:hypothetical protein